MNFSRNSPAWLLIAGRFLFSVIRLAYGVMNGSVPFAGQEE